MLLKKTMYDKLVVKANNIDTSGFALEKKLVTQTKKMMILMDLLKNRL